MRDIARAANVSRSTVSRVLSGTPTGFPVAERTRERIFRAAREMGFRPNPLARGLRGAPTNLLGLIVRDIIDPLDAAAIKAASMEASRRGYNVVLGHVDRHADEGPEVSHILEARLCDAIVLLGRLADQPAFAAELAASNVPMVAVWHSEPTTSMPTVNVDNRAGITAALDHLRALGHRRIAMASDRRIPDVQEREAAYLGYLDDHDIELRPGYMQDTSGGATGAHHVLDPIMDLDEPPTAIVCSTDVDAISLMEAAQRRGLYVPDELSIVGFDDIPAATMSVPALTTVRQPVTELIGAAVHILFESLEGRGLPLEALHPVIGPSLVIRDSTGPAPA